MRRPRSTAVAATAATAIAAFAAAPALGAIGRGPSTSTDPYVLPVAPGVDVTSLLTVNDDRAAGNGYEMTGIPDGLGAFRPTGDRFTLLMNHELRPTVGAVRRHGQIGAFVSKLHINRRTKAIREGFDFIDPSIAYWNYVTQSYEATPSPAGPNPRDPGSEPFVAGSAQLARFCSGNLTDPGVLYNERSGRGYAGQLYFANEENGDEGREFGVNEFGEAQQLPRMGLFSWENTLAADNRSDTTLVIGNEDGADGQLWAYTGTKRKRGNAFDKAGLTNGTNHVIDAVDEAVATDEQFRAKYGKGKAVEVDLANVDWDQSGAAQNREAKTDGLSLNRIEDGVWDPRNRNDYYFTTTEGGSPGPEEGGPEGGAGAPEGITARDGGGVWRLSLEDIDNPQLGGTLTLLLDGSEAPLLNKPDNIEMDESGHLLIQEDPGLNVQLARIVAYDTRTGRRGVVARFDPALFAPKTANQADAAITIDEESSGILDAKAQFGSGYFLFDAQVHAPIVDRPEYVERGQLLLLKVDLGRSGLYDLE